MNRKTFVALACFACSVAIPLTGFGQQDGGRPRQVGERGFGGPPRDGGGPGRGGPDMVRMVPVMAALDKDGDGVISSEEIAGAVAALKTLDKNQDGKLDHEELRPAFAGPGGPGGPGGRGPGGGGFGGPGGGPSDGAGMVSRLMALDKNSDGQLSKDEVGDRLASLFGRADADKNGILTKAEIEAMAAQGDARGPGGRGGEGGDRPRRPAAE